METGNSGRDTTSNAILEALLKEPLGFEKLVQSLEGKASRGTVNKYLKELVEEEIMVELAPRKFYGERPPYQIVESKKQQITEKVRDLVNKQKINNLFNLATPQETTELTDFLFKFFERDSKNVVPQENATAIYVILCKLKLRKKLMDLKRIGAPKEIIAVGERKVKGEELKLTFVESLKFEAYPVNLEEAKNHFLVTDFKNSKRGDSFFDTIREEDKEFASVLAAIYKQLLGYDPFTH